MYLIVLLSYNNGRIYNLKIDLKPILYIPHFITELNVYVSTQNACKNLNFGNHPVQNYANY